MKTEKKAKGNHTILLKQANRYLVLQSIMKYGHVSTEEIVKITNISRPTVLNITRELSDNDVIVRDGFSESSGGRAAGLWTLNREKHFAVGVDFEFPQVRMALANLKNEILASRTITYSQDIEKQDLIGQFYEQLKDFIDTCGYSKEDIEGIGVGLPGILDTTQGTSVSIERIRNWTNVDFVHDLEQYINLPVYIKNDVHLMGLVEKRLYLGSDVTDFVYIGFRAGIGSVIYQQGRPMRGERGNAGFIGHTTLFPNGLPCCCGSRGCLDMYSGKLSITRQYVEKRSQTSLDPTLESSFDALVERSFQGDTVASEVLRDAGFYLGVAIANLIKTVEVTTVIIGGSPVLKDSVFIQAAQEALDAYLKGGMNTEIHLACGSMPEQEYALGGCFLVFDHLFSKPKLSLSVV